MTLFRPCIDLHQGKVKQIVGGTLDLNDNPQTNYISDKDAAWYASLYRQDNLRGGHVIMLGPGNEAAAKAALSAWQGGLQIGGGINPNNAQEWILAGADKVIVTSFLFTEKNLDLEKVEQMSKAVGSERLVIDLSCRRTDRGYFVATDKWQTVTSTMIEKKTLNTLALYCSEFLVHAADVEGKCRGIETELVSILKDISPLPCTYAGGAKAKDDLDLVKQISEGRIDLTFGSALDLFGGNLVHYEDCVAWNLSQSR